MTDLDGSMWRSELTTMRRLALAGAITGIALVLSLCVPVLATTVLFVWGEEISGPSDGSMFHGAQVFFGWLITSLLGLTAIALLAAAALTLDILLLVRLDRLHRMRARSVAPLGWSLLAGTGLVSTPVLVVLLFVPVWIFGPGLATNTALVVLFVMMGLLPIAGRIAQILASRRVRAPQRP